MPGTITATWSGSFARNPLAYTAGVPPLLPLSVPVSNIAGQWLFAIVAWRQDSGVAGVLQFPSTISVSDDAGNFWIPVQSGQQSAGIVRIAAWMAPAARQATTVYLSPSSTSAGDAYQSSLAVLIVEVTANCPWYTVTSSASAFTNQGGSVTLSETPAAGQFTIGAIAWDNTGGSVTPVSAGWTGLPAVNATNSTNHSGDLQLDSWYATTPGSTLTLSASGTPTMDWAEVMIVVQGVTNTLPFPYTAPLESWPTLITEIAAGPVLNLNPAMANGATDWSAQQGAVVAVNWPVYQPWPNYQALIEQSLQLTPTGGAANFAGIISTALQPVITSVHYNSVAWVYSVAGWPNCQAQINWYDISQVFITTSGLTTGISVPAGTWTLLTLPAGVFPPSNAAFGQCVVVERSLAYPSGTVPASAVLYIGYAGFGYADSYENTPLDNIAWVDFSSRGFTQGPISISRGIQYEQQSLEAGTLSVYLANSDGAVTFGNILSVYWPTIGDTDVPIRLRAVWPLSVTPYYVLFSGFTDQVRFGWDQGTRYGYAEIDCADAWSRLVAQMLDAGLQEVLQDSPAVFCPVSLTGANLAISNNTPVTQIAGPFGSGAATGTFSSNVITLAGNPSQSCWQSQGVTPVSQPNEGVALAYFPPASQPLPPVSGGMTVEFWFSPTVVTASQPANALTMCTCWSPYLQMWTLWINNQAGAGSSDLRITVYDKTTGAATTTSVGTIKLLANATAAAASYYAAVTFTQSSLTVVLNPGGLPAVTETVTVSCNLPATALGFSWAGNAGPLLGTNPDASGSLGFCNIAIADIAITAGILPAARIAMHYGTAQNAWPNELDTSRLARVAGYAGATPVVMQMRGSDLAVPPAADADPVTAITDTNGQVTSSYFTNIAASTLAFMFVNGPGALIYRRRLESYDRALPQWAAGENATLPLNGNTLGQSSSTTGWFTFSGATLTSANLPAVSPLFEFTGLLKGDGVTSTPQIHYQFSAGVPVTVGLSYSVSCLVYSPQGWPTGVSISFVYLTGGGSSISTQTSPTVPLAAGSITYVTTTPLAAPATAATALLSFAVQGTPSTSVQFYVTNIQFVLVPAAPAGGAAGLAAEVPYLVSTKLSSDRALLYNQAILTQFGTGTTNIFQGTNLIFQPTSGVLVTIQSTPSVIQRAGVPYTATIYLNNTAQALPYVLSEPSMEDFGNWVTQSLDTPLLRPDQVTITPAATTQAMQMALQAEVGDTATYHRRSLGAPEVRILTYISKLTHDIDIASGQWNTRYELSPFPQGTVLACDDVIHGTLTGGNYYGW